MTLSFLFFVSTDIDECHLGLHTCHESAKCVNTEGGFRCECQDSEYDDGCKLHCIQPSTLIERFDGETFIDDSSSCSTCSCHRGVISCSAKVCDCSDSEVDLDCCPHCDDDSPRCRHQENTSLTFASGQNWTYQCQVCECMVSFFVLCSLSRSNPLSISSGKWTAGPWNVLLLSVPTQSSRKATVVLTAKMIHVIGFMIMVPLAPTFRYHRYHQPQMKSCRCLVTAYTMGSSTGQGTRLLLIMIPVRHANVR